MTYQSLFIQIYTTDKYTSDRSREKIYAQNTKDIHSAILI